MNEAITYTLIRSNRKTISLQVDRRGEVIVRAPQRMSDARIEAFLGARQDWIVKTVRQMKARSANYERKLTEDELMELRQKAQEYIPERVAFYASKAGVNYNRVTIRTQKTRWGSCSAAGNLNFNCLLMLMPKEVIDSVVVHELCHLLEMNHSHRFYNEVYRVFPNYNEWNAWLKQHGSEILSRI